MIAINSPLPLHSGDACITVSPNGTTIECTTAFVPAQTRHWTALAVISLVVAGLLSLAVVIGRLPVVSRLIGDPLFFKRCLVVHVDLALLAWFYTFIAALTGLRTPVRTGKTIRGALVASGAGMVLMLAGATVPGAAPVLSNYIFRSLIIRSFWAASRCFSPA